MSAGIQVYSGLYNKKHKKGAGYFTDTFHIYGDLLFDTIQ